MDTDTQLIGASLVSEVQSIIITAGSMVEGMAGRALE